MPNVDEFFQIFIESRSTKIQIEYNFWLGSAILMGLNFEENKTLQSIIYRGDYYELHTELKG